MGLFLLLNKSAFYLLLMFILTSLVVSRRVKRSAVFARHKSDTGLKTTINCKTNGKNEEFFQKARNLIRKSKAPSKVSIYKILPVRLCPFIFRFDIKVF
jgi:hypothetical protein